MDYKLKFSIFLMLLVLLLTGCVKEETKTYYMNIEGYITHTDSKMVSSGKSSTKYLVIYIDGSDYSIRYSNVANDLLQIGNKVKFKVSHEHSRTFYEYEILEDNNSRMREVLLKESKELESVGE